jgi:hypothetical protein
MTTKRLKRPRDPIPLGKLIVDIATGQVEDRIEDGKNPAAVELGRRGQSAGWCRVGIYSEKGSGCGNRAGYRRAVSVRSCASSATG